MSHPYGCKKCYQSVVLRPSGDINDTLRYVMLETGFPLFLCRENYNYDTLDILDLIKAENIIINEPNNSLTLKAILFPAQTIRRLSKKYNLKNDVTLRYERGLTVQDLEYAYRRAIYLIKEIHLGSITQLNFSHVEKIYDPIKPISINLNKIISRLGKLNLKSIEINTNEIANILDRLGFDVLKSGADLQVTVPYYRQNDIKREIDLIEEVGRSYGFNNFVDIIPRVRSHSELTSQEIFYRKIRSRLKILGFNEFINYSLSSEFNSSRKGYIQLQNPLTVDFSNLRQTLLYSILNNISYNLKTGNGLINGYEIGRLFNIESSKYEEQNFLSLVIAGDNFNHNWYNSNQNIDWFYAKGIMEELLSDFSSISWEKNEDSLNEIYEPIFHPYNFTNLFTNRNFLGIFGQLHPKILKEKNINYKSYALEINMEVLLHQYKKNIKTSKLYEQYSIYPYIIRDITLNVQKKVTSKVIKEKILNGSDSILKNIEVISVYEGEKIKSNYKNISFRLYYQANDRTLTIPEVDHVHNRICDQLSLEFA